MGVSYVSGSAVTRGVTVAAPSGIVAGRLLVAVLGGEGTIPAPFTLPSGWVLGPTGPTSGGYVWQQVAYKIATGSEPSTYTFTHAGTHTTSNVVVLQLAGATTTTTPFDVYGFTFFIGPTPPVTFPRPTTTVAGDFLLLAIAAENASTFTTPGGTSAGPTTGGGGATSAASFYVVQTTPGAVPLYTTNLGFTTTNSQTMTLAIKPGPTLGRSVSDGAATADAVSGALASSRNVTDSAISTDSVGTRGDGPYVVSASVRTTSGQTAVVTAPSTLTPGNLLVAFVTANGRTDTFIVTPGWIPGPVAPPNTPTGPNQSAAVFYKVVTATEPFNYTFGSGHNFTGVVVVQVATATTTAPFDTYLFETVGELVATGAVSTVTYPQPTTVAANDLLLFCLGLVNAIDASTPPTTSLVAGQGNNGVSNWVFDTSQSLPGMVGSFTSDFTSPTTPTFTERTVGRALTLPIRGTSSPSRDVTDSAFTGDSARQSRVSATVTDTALTADTVSGTALPAVPLMATSTNRNASTARPYSTPIPPNPVPGPSGLHDYEVIVTDMFGIAYGQIVTAVPTQIEWVLDAIGQATITFWILDPSAKNLLPLSSLPGVREIQIWRDQVLIWWGWPTAATYDAKQVHLTCTGLLYPLSTRFFGPVVKNYATNPSFEEPGAALGFIPGWTINGVTAGPVYAAGGNPVVLGTAAVRLIQTGAGTDTFIFQDIPVSAPAAEATFFDLSAWVFIDPAYTPFAPAGPNTEERGLFISLINETDVEVTYQFQTITASTPAGSWQRLETGIVVPAGMSGTLEIRLYAPQGSVLWDNVRLTVEESVGSALYGSDVTWIIRQIVTYAQDPTRGKSSLNFSGFKGCTGPTTGVILERFYQLATNAEILDALNEFPSLSACDFEVTWDATGHSRTLQIFAPSKGSVKWNYPIEILGNVTDLEGAVDGTQVGTTQRVLGQGTSGSSEEIGYVAFPSYLGGRVGTSVTITQGATLLSADGLTFTSADIGQPIYSLAAGVIAVGTVITSVTSATTVGISEPLLMSLPVGATQIGVGGIVIDQTESSIPTQPVRTLQSTAEASLRKNLQAQPLPTSRQRADGPDGLFGLVEVGDVVPVRFDYGWLEFGPALMRISAITLYPPTEEMSVTLNVTGPA